MKKKTFITAFTIIAISITAYSFVNWKRDNPHLLKGSKIVNNALPADQAITTYIFPTTESNFFYDVDSRFVTTITKEDLQKAKTILDLVPKKDNNDIDSFWDVKIGIATKNGKSAKGKNNSLSSSQLNLLKSLDYSTNFYIEAFCNRKNDVNGELEVQCFVYYITIVPEKEVSYELGADALIYYLKKNSIDLTLNVDENQLRAGKIFFNVSSSGKVENVRLDNSSGYSKIDKKMLELIQEIPGNWIPAENSEGTYINQELVFSFGMVGC